MFDVFVFVEGLTLQVFNDEEWKQNSKYQISCCHQSQRQQILFRLSMHTALAVL